VLFKTPIGVLVFVLKLGVKPVLLGVQAAYKVVETLPGKAEPGVMIVPEPFAAVFQPAKT
jgi:hypothetical protein